MPPLEVKKKEIALLSKKQKENELSEKFESLEFASKLGELYELTESQKNKIKKTIKKEIDAWKQGTADLHRDLQDINDLVEGVVEETDYPYIGASNIHIPVVSIYLKVAHSIFRRSILGAGDVWYSETDDEQLEEFLVPVENSINYLAMNKWNIAESLSDAFWTAPKDGLGVLQVPYVEDYETVKDVVYIGSKEDFINEFPSPEDAGLKPKEWESLFRLVAKKASKDNPLEIPITYEKQIYAGPKGEVVELIDFVTFPATAKEISRSACRGYGKRFYLRRGEIKRKREDGIWDKESVNRLLEKSKTGSKVSSYVKSKDTIEGLNRSGMSDDYEFFELVYYIELEKEEGEVKLLLTYSYDHDELVHYIEYPYRVDFYALFRVEKKANRLIGSSYVKEISPINEEIDIQHNQRIQSREISTVPSFKGMKSAKKDFDPEAEENRWRPGVTFWLENPDSFQQFKVQPTDLGESIQEESGDIRMCSIMVGLDPFASSGLASPYNPDAPGNKTMALINQSNLRMEDPISELRSGVEKVGEICLSHLYQFGSGDIDFFTTNTETGKIKGSIPKRVLRKGIKLKMSAITITMNPDAEFVRTFNQYKAFMSDPIFAQRAKSRVEMLRRTARSGRLKGIDKILPTLEEIEQEQIQQQAQAMQLLQQQQQQQQEQAQAMQLENTKRQRKDRVGAISDKVRETKLLQQLKEQAGQKAAELIQSAGGNGGVRV